MRQPVQPIGRQREHRPRSAALQRDHLHVPANHLAAAAAAAAVGAGVGVCGLGGGECCAHVMAERNAAAAAARSAAADERGGERGERAAELRHGHDDGRLDGGLV